MSIKHDFIKDNLARLCGMDRRPDNKSSCCP